MIGDQIREHIHREMTRSSEVLRSMMRDHRYVNRTRGLEQSGMVVPKITKNEASIEVGYLAPYGKYVEKRYGDVEAQINRFIPHLKQALEG